MKFSKKLYNCIVSEEEWRENPDSGISELLKDFPPIKKQYCNPRTDPLPMSGGTRVCARCGRVLPIGCFPVNIYRLTRSKMCSTCMTRCRARES